MKKNELRLPPVACLLSAFVIFGTIGILRGAIPYPSSVIAFVRGLTGCVFLLAVQVISGRKPDFAAIRNNLLLLVVSGALIGANWVCLFEAYRFTGISTATMCYYMAPVFVIFFSCPVLKEPLTAKKLICAAAAVIGMIPVSGIIGGAEFSPVGVLFGLAAAVMYACVILLNKRLKGISAADRTVIQLAAAAAAVLPYALVTEDISALPVTAPIIGLLALAGILHTGIAYALYFAGVEKVPAHTAALFSYIDPITAVALSCAVLGEELTPLKAAGMVVVLCAAAAGELLPDKRGKKR